MLYLIHEVLLPSVRHALCSKPVEAGYGRQAVTALWYEGVSELFGVTQVHTVVMLS